jgi:hypothetical protein
VSSRKRRRTVLASLYGALRVVRYEDTEGVGDFGLQPMRLVRLFAQKP